MSEKDLDKALEQALREKPDFVSWLLRKTKFAHCAARYAWSRSNNPWGRVTMRVRDNESGGSREESREGETDVLVVFEDSLSGKRFALHIENKTATGAFTPLQPEMYRVRAEAWLGKSNYGSYEDFETMLVAPQAFYDRNAEGSSLFDRFVPHEEIAEFVREFSR